MRKVAVAVTNLRSRINPRELSQKEPHLTVTRQGAGDPGSVRKQAVTPLCTRKSTLIWSVLSWDFFILS